MANVKDDRTFTRRDLLKGGGALIITWSLPSFVRAAAQGGQAPAVPGGQWSPRPDLLDNWLRIGQDGSVTAFSGAIETGQSKRVAWRMIIAEELDTPFDSVTLVMGDTATGPDQGNSGGSNGIYEQVEALRQASAEARKALLNLAAQRFGVPAPQLSVSNGVVTVTANRAQRATYGELIGGRQFNVKLVVTGQRASEMSLATEGVAPVKDPRRYTVIGQSPMDPDHREMVTARYEKRMQNFRLPGMLHARMVLPPNINSKLVRVNGFKSGSPPPGFVKVVTRGDFVAVVAQDEWQAVKAMRDLDVTWSIKPIVFNSGHQTLKEDLKKHKPAVPDVTTVVDRRIVPGQVTDVNRGNVPAALASAAKRLEAEYYFPMQAHGGMGPDCAVADVRAGEATIWCPTSYPAGASRIISTLIGLPPEKIRVIWRDSGGQYGRFQTGEDAGPAAAVVSQDVGRPVRLSWMREQDFESDLFIYPYTFKMQGAVDADGNVSAFATEFWSFAIDPRTEGGPLATIFAGVREGGPMRPHSVIPVGGGDVNSYEFPNESLLTHHLAPNIRVQNGGLRVPRHLPINFAHECFLDELAAAAGADPIEFRIRHIRRSIPFMGKQPMDVYDRTIAVLEKVREAARWQPRPAPAVGARGGARMRSGRGVAFVANYKETYCATTAEVEVDTQTGRVRVMRMVQAVDPGIVINKDVGRDVVESGTLHTVSRTLHEEVQFDATKVLIHDWATYPIMRFTEVPEIEVVWIEDPTVHTWAGGLSETPCTTVTAAIANAIFDACGARVRDVPFTPQRVLAALKA